MSNLSIQLNRIGGSWRARWRKETLPYLFILPAVSLMSILILFPLLQGIVMSFTKVDIGNRGAMTFVGLEQYTKLFDDEIFWRAWGNTFVWTIGVVAFEYLIGLGIALLLNERIPLRGLVRGLVLVPWIIPSVAAALDWRWIYEGQFGILNHLLAEVGIIREPLDWLADPKLAMPAVIAVGVWKEVPFVAVVLLAGLQAIPKDLYESAEVDGAQAWQRFWHITMPHLRDISLIITLLSTIWTFNHFDLIYVMTGGGPSNVTHLLATYAYLRAFADLDIGNAAAMSVLMLIVLLLFAVFYVRMMREEGSAQ